MYHLNCFIPFSLTSGTVTFLFLVFVLWASSLVLKFNTLAALSLFQKWRMNFTQVAVTVLRS